MLKVVDTTDQFLVVHLQLIRFLENMGNRDRAKPVVLLADAKFTSEVAKADTPRQVIFECNRLAEFLVKIDELDRAEKLIERARVAAEPDRTATGKSAERTAKIRAYAYDNMRARPALERARLKKGR